MFQPDLIVGSLLVTQAVDLVVQREHTHTHTHTQ